MRWSIAIVIFALAGCVAGPGCDKPNLSSRDASGPAFVDAGETLHELIVIDGDGAPIDASVRPYFAIKPGSSEDWFFFHSSTSTNANLLVYADMAAENGSAEVSAPRDAPLTWVASAPGMTEEWVRAVPGTPSTLMLHPARVEVVQESSWGGVDVTYTYLGLAGEQSVRWRAAPMPWHADAPVNAEMTRRLVELDVWLNWTTGPGEHADMGLGLGRADNRLDRYANSEDDMIAWGEHSERIHIDVDDLEGLEAVASEVLYAGPTQSAAAAPLGVPYTITVVGQLSPEKLRNRYCTEEYNQVGALKHVDEFNEARMPQAEDRSDEEPAAASAPAPPTPEPAEPDHVRAESPLPAAVAIVALALAFSRAARRK